MTQEQKDYYRKLRGDLLLEMIKANKDYPSVEKCEIASMTVEQLYLQEKAFLGKYDVHPI